MTIFRRSVRSGLVILVIALGASLLTDTRGVAELGETSSGLSETYPLVEPALRRAIEELKANREEVVPTELALPSGVPTVTPQTDPNLADGVDVREEADSLIKLYAAKYGVATSTLEQIVECESRYDPEATGSAGERGLAQFLFGTWFTTPQARFGWDAAYHPAVNLEAAAWMLSERRVGEFHALQGCY